jgi:hypothetical protein
MTREPQHMVIAVKGRLVRIRLRAFRRPVSLYAARARFVCSLRRRFWVDHRLFLYTVDNVLSLDQRSSPATSSRLRTYKPSSTLSTLSITYQTCSAVLLSSSASSPSSRTVSLTPILSEHTMYLLHFLSPPRVGYSHPRGRGRWC